MPSDPALFFQIAAGLIPVLLFGGLLTEGLKPPRHWLPRTMKLDLSLVVMAALFLSFAVYAETNAIAGALGAPVGKSGTWAVALTLTLGTAAIGLSVIWPWVRKAAWPRLPLLVVLVLVIASAVQSAQLLTSSVDLAATTSALARAEARAEAPEPNSARLTQIPLQLLEASEARVTAMQDAGLIPSRQAERERLRLINERIDFLVQAASDEAADAVRDLNRRLDESGLEQDE